MCGVERTVSFVRKRLQLDHTSVSREGAEKNTHLEFVAQEQKVNFYNKNNVILKEMEKITAKYMQKAP